MNIGQDRHQWRADAKAVLIVRGRKNMAVTATVSDHSAVSKATRWTQLASCVVCMVMIANLQYGWTLFVNPMKDAHPGWSFDFLQWHWDTLSAITLAFTIFIALETWLTPIEGW